MNYLKVGGREKEMTSCIRTKIFNDFFKNFHFSRRKGGDFAGEILSESKKKKMKKISRASRRRWHSGGTSSANVVSSPLGEVVIPKVPFHELIFKSWSLWERKTAVVCGATGRKYTFRKVLKYSKAMAASFQNKLQLKKGDFIAVILPNCPEYPIAVLASSQSGIIPTTVNPLYTIEEIKLQVRDCDAKAILTDHQNFGKCVQLEKSMGRQIPTVVLRTSRDVALPEGGIDFFELFDSSTSGNFDPVAIEPDDPLIVPYSSGTTGSPKGVLLTHRNLVSNLVQISHPETMIMNPTTRFQQDTILGVLPMFHIYGMVIVTFYSLKEGCRLLVLPKFDPRLYMRNVVTKKANILYVVPQLMKFLSHEKVLPKYFKYLQYIVNAASPMSLEAAYKILEKAPHVKIVQGYGMTESSPALAHTSTKRMQKLSAIGIPIASTKFKVTSLETGEALPKGAEGELCAWGPQVMTGYLNRPEDTKNSFDRDGWLRTGDIAYYDDDGDFYIVDRLKSLIKVKGFQVSPAELEETLLVDPRIKEVAVLGVKDEKFGEVPRAFVVLRAGARMTKEEVEEIVKQRLSSHKHLRGGVRFMEKLPKNSTGKIIRKALKDSD